VFAVNALLAMAWICTDLRADLRRADRPVGRGPSAFAAATLPVRLDGTFAPATEHQVPSLLLAGAVFVVYRCRRT
jgi:hypothetical protein